MTKQKKSRLNRRKVLELKSKMIGCKTKAQKLFNTFDNTDEVEKGYSNPEISLALNPKYIRKGKDGNDEPTLEGKMKTKTDIRDFRKKIISGNSQSIVIIPFAKKTQDGYLYFNMKTERDFDTVVELSESVIEGIKKMLKEFMKLINMKETKKEDVNKEYRQQLRALELALNQARKKKRT